jgi:hypothetical protein
MKITLAILLGLIAVTLTACVPGGGTYHSEHIAGFFSGIWHGWIAPISLIISFFNPSVRIYEVYNIGFWYDLGFYIAVISGFGGISVTRNKWKSHKEG